MGREDGSMPAQGQQLQLNTHTHTSDAIYAAAQWETLKNQDAPPGLKLSSGNENFKRAARRPPIFCLWKILKVETDIFKRD